MTAIIPLYYAEERSDLHQASQVVHEEDKGRSMQNVN